MKKACVDYRQLRPSNLNTPEFSHLKLLLGWLVYFILYFLTENLIPLERCHLVHSALDDLIPFCELFVLPYVLWYVLIIGSLGYFLLYDVDSFKKLQVFIIITQAVAMVVYILWPSWQDLRPEVFPRANIFTWLLSLIYRVDTPTGVCPSLHVAYSLGICSAWLKYKPASKLCKGLITGFVILICISVAFVKQHSVIDIFWALPLGLLAEIIVYGKSYWLPRLRHREEAPNL